MIIDYVLIDHVRAEIGSASRRFPDYFGIDSMALLLGKNGAGKTRLLLNVAEVLTRGTEFGDQGHWAARTDDDDSFTSDAKRPPDGFGVVYFTPIPYTRSTDVHPRFVDASRIPAKTLQPYMFRRYDWIAGILDETHRPLKARICYRKSIVERAIVPFILDTDNECRLNDGSLERERVRVLETRRETQTQIVPPEFVRAVSNFLHSRLSKNGHEHRLIALATLERQIRRVGQRAAVISYFLKAFDLASVSEPGLLEDHSDLARASSDFDKIYESTFNVLAASEHIDTINDRTVEGIEFESNSAIVDIVIRSPNSAVEFSWSDLSSGLLSLIQQFTRLDYAVARLRKSAIKSVLLLIDEADAFLHLDWQRQYVENLNTFLSELKRHHNLDSLQVLIATHSPVISGDFPSPMVQRLDSERSEPFKTFGNSLDSLVFDAFETSSIGSFAAKKIRILRERFLRGELDDEDRALIKEIGDPGLQRAVLKGQAKMAFNIPPSPSGKASD